MPQGAGRAGSKWLRRLPFILLLIVALVGILTLRDQLSFATLTRHREMLLAFRDQHFAEAVLAFMATYVAVVALSLPGALVMTLTGGFLFGLFPGVLFNVFSATIGATCLFLAARAGFGADLQARIAKGGGAPGRLMEGLRRNEISVLFLMRLVPAVPFFVADLIAAAMNVSLGRFVFTTFFGIIPGALVYTSVGAGLGEVFARREAPDAGIIFEPRILGPILGLAVLAALPIVIRLFRSKDPEVEQIETDICIIGAGSGGLSVAAGAVQMGARVVLIEAGRMGGDCLNHGCVPSKALLAAAKSAHAMTEGAQFGITPVVPQVDFAAVKDHVAGVIDAIAPIDSQERFEGMGVRVIRSWARFISSNKVEAGEHVVSARRFVIATGSRPFVPDIPGLAEVGYLTNETIFALRERPEHLLILGSGPVAMEMAQAHRRLGCEVTVIGRTPPLGREDRELVAPVLERMRVEGVEIIENGMVMQAETGDGVTLVLSDGRRLNGSHLLVATGRKTTVDDLGLAAAGVEWTERGVTVDRSLRTSNRRIYAVGDAAGGPQLTHLANYHAGIVIRQAVLGLPAKVSMAYVPRAIYTDPELAQVGLTEVEARKVHGNRLQVLRWPLADNDRARTEGRTSGQIKLLVANGRPVGVGIVGAQAGELITLWALAISAKLRLSAIAGMVVPYPTLSEVSKRAAGAYFSPKLFDSPLIKRIVRLVQRWLP